MIEDQKQISEVSISWSKWKNENKCIMICFTDKNYENIIKSSKENDEEKDKMIASVSHEIRTPINGMKGLLEMIDLSTDSKARSRYIQLCQNNCDFLLNIVNTMLDLQMIKKNKFKLNLTEVNLSQIFQQLQSLFEFNCSQNDLYFKIEIDPNLPPTILTDRNRLFQILVNLTGNALKFTTQGGITAAATIDPEYPGKVKLSITDTGVGIKEDEKSNLFTMFGTLKATRKQNIQGIGLGLVISNEFAKILNLGQTGIDCRSKYKVGTSFFFYLPIKRPLMIQSADELATPGMFRAFE